MKKFLLLAGVLASLGVSLANASVEVRIINAAGGGDTGWIVCGGTSCSTGAITVGNYTIASNIAIQLNNGNNPLLDMSYVASTSVANAGTIVFEAMANGYTVNAPSTQLVGNGNSSLGDTVNLTSYGGNNNTICPAGPNACTPSSNGSNVLNNLTGLSENLSVVASGGGATVNPYSLGLVLSLVNPVRGGTASGDIALNAVPEPASVTLLGGVMLVAVSAIRRKMRRA